MPAVNSYKVVSLPLWVSKYTECPIRRCGITSYAGIFFFFFDTGMTRVGMFSPQWAILAFSGITFFIKEVGVKFDWEKLQINFLPEIENRLILTYHAVNLYKVVSLPLWVSKYTECPIRRCGISSYAGIFFFFWYRYDKSWHVFPTMGYSCIFWYNIFHKGGRC